MVNIRPARTSDVKAIRQLVDSYAAPGQMLSKETVTLYESVQEFTVAEVDGKVIGCGALHVLWDDLAEVRTVAVEKSFHNQGVGHQILERIIERAREVGVARIFCLTFRTELHQMFIKSSFVRTMPVWLSSWISKRQSQIPLAIPACS